MSAVIQPVAPWALPAAFAAMQPYKQWFIYRLDNYDPTRGKYQKTPIDARTRREPVKDHGGIEACSDWNTVASMGAELQSTARAGEFYLPGFWLTAADPFWFLDIDQCVIQDPQGTPTWSILSMDLLGAFQGAAREISSSQRGWHVIGTGVAPPHGCKNPLGLEFYTQDRGVALTCSQASGNAAADYSASLPALVNTYFPPKAKSSGTAEWRDTPCEGSQPIADDAELIRWALNYQDASSLWGDKASFADLWMAHPAKLARAFPSSTGDAWDRSSADLALANRLAYYTGNDCERMKRLMEMSDLKRDKWGREEYLHGTILEACTRQKQRGRWYGDRKTATAPTTNATPVSATDATPSTIMAYTMTLNRKNQYDATIENLVFIVGAQRQTRVGFDEFRGRIMVAPAGTEYWRPLSDTDMIQLREILAREQRFAPIPKELMRDAMQLVAERYSFDSAITWLNGLTWDCVPRVERFLATHCGAADDEYTRAVSRYIWSGLAGRVLEPGCQLDMVVALQSPQGKHKSTSLQAMAPTGECFTDGLSLHEDDDDFKRLIREKLVAEIAEMVGLSKADVDLVKRVITRRWEEWIEKWQTQPSRYPRRCMLFATTNNEKFLPPDETGQRRWLPVEIAGMNRDLIATDRDQLWAEGAAIWRQRGIQWADAERLAAGRHHKYEDTDVWTDDIERWLNNPEGPVIPGQAPKPPPCTRPLALSEVLQGAVNLRPSAMDARAEKRAGRVMRQLGYDRRNVKVNDKVVKRWVRV